MHGPRAGQDSLGVDAFDDGGVRRGPSPPALYQEQRVPWPTNCHSSFCSRALRPVDALLPLPPWPPLALLAARAPAFHRFALPSLSCFGIVRAFLRTLRATRGLQHDHRPRSAALPQSQPHGHAQPRQRHQAQPGQGQVGVRRPSKARRRDAQHLLQGLLAPDPARGCLGSGRRAERRCQCGARGAGQCRQVQLCSQHALEGHPASSATVATSRGSAVALATCWGARRSDRHAEAPHLMRLMCCRGARKPRRSCEARTKKPLSHMLPTAYEVVTMKATSSEGATVTASISTCAAQECVGCASAGGLKCHPHRARRGAPSEASPEQSTAPAA